MSTIELKNMISNGLTPIEDLEFLLSIHNLIESRVEDQIYILSEEQSLRIEETRIDFLTGKTVSNEEVIEGIENLYAIKEY